MGTYMIHADGAIGKFVKRLASITAVKGGHCSTVQRDDPSPR